MNTNIKQGKRDFDLERVKVCGIPAFHAAALWHLSDGADTIFVLWEMKLSKGVNHKNSTYINTFKWQKKMPKVTVSLKLSGRCTMQV